MKRSIKTYSALFTALMAAIFESLHPQSTLATTNAYFAAPNGLYGGGADAASLNMGHSFTITGTSVNVSALGVFDYGADGLIASHLVGIYSVTNGVSTPVANASVTVPSGTAATLINGYRYQSLPTPVILGPGNYYVIVFQMNGYINHSDPYTDNNAPANSNNGFNGLTGVTDTGCVFEFNVNQGPAFPIQGSVPLSSTNDFGSASFLYDAGLIPTVTPAMTNALTGQNVTFTASALGQTPISYQWFQGNPPGTILAGQTSTTLTLSNLDLSKAGNYFVVVSNVYGSATSSVAAVTLVYPPSIVTPPSGTNLSLHGSAILSVTASGTGPLQYQWSLGSNVLVNATNSTYTLTNFKTNQAGDYTVTVSNAYGQVTSDPALVEMLPSLNAQFTGAAGFWGQPATLTVGATGSGTLQYQWFYNGTPIGGATNTTLTFSSIQFTNGGLYSVVVSSQYGSVTNAPAQVVVNPAGLALGFSPTLTITGVVGYSYIIQSSTNLGSASNWVTLTNLTLTSPVQVWADTSVNSGSPFITKYFYQILPAQ